MCFKKALTSLGVLSILLMVPFSAFAAVGDGAIVTAPLASTLYGDERDDEVMYGMTVRITGEKDGLYEVKTQYNYTTMISPDVLSVGTEAADAWKAGVTHWVVAPFADVVPTAVTQSYPPLATLPRGSLVKVTGEQDNYYKVQLHDGREAYARKPSLRPLRVWGTSDETMTRACLTEDALSYLGTSYRWGGKTPEGIDCSGFASMVYMLNGLDIYRNSRPEAGYPIALFHIEGTPDNTYTKETLAKAKPGDMLYWSGHQGIYLGDGKYIHANGSSFNTRINSLFEGDPDYRADLATPESVYTWGTAYPEKPGELIVRKLIATPFTSGDETGWYRFYAKADGYAPTKAILYPEGTDSPVTVVVSAPRRMLYDSPTSTHATVPAWRYTTAGSRTPAIVLVNETGWRPEGKTISSDVFKATDPIVVP